MEKSAHLPDNSGMPPPTYEQVSKPFINNQPATSCHQNYYGQGASHLAQQPLVDNFNSSHHGYTSPSAPPQSLEGHQHGAYQPVQSDLTHIQIHNGEDVQARPDREKATWAKLCGPFCFIFWIINLVGVVICVPISIKRELALIGLAASLFLAIVFGCCAASFCSKNMNRFLASLCCSNDRPTNFGENP